MQESQSRLRSAEYQKRFSKLSSGVAHPDVYLYLVVLYLSFFHRYGPIVQLFGVLMHFTWLISPPFSNKIRNGIFDCCIERRMSEKFS